MTYFATTDDEGRPTGFYADTINGDNIPPGAIELTDDEYAHLLLNQRTHALVDGAVVEIGPRGSSDVVDSEE